MKKLFKLIILFLFIPALIFAAEPKADKIRNTPAGDISSENVQAALNELDTEKLSSYTETDPLAILKDGTSTTTAPVPFAQGVYVNSDIYQLIVGNGISMSTANLLVNPLIKAANGELLTLQVVGNDKFKVDAEGDTTVLGGLTVGAIDAGTGLTVYDLYGDAMTFSVDTQILHTPALNVGVGFNLGNTGSLTGDWDAGAYNIQSHSFTAIDGGHVTLNGDGELTPTWTISGGGNLTVTPEGGTTIAPALIPPRVYLSTAPFGVGATYASIAFNPVSAFSNTDIMWLGVNGAVKFKVEIDGDIALCDAGDISVGTTTGTKIGTATNQKLGFFNATPIVQQAQTVDIKDLLVNLGFYAGGVAAATPLNLDAGALSAGTGSFSADVTITEKSPSLYLVDSDAASDDYSINVNASVFTLKNDTDGTTAISISDTGRITFDGGADNAASFGTDAVTVGSLNGLNLGNPTSDSVYVVVTSPPSMTGDGNTLFGKTPFYSLTTGTSNTGIGVRAGYYITTGRFNTIMGFDAGGQLEAGADGNTFVGLDAGYLFTGDCDNNTAIGIFAGGGSTYGIDIDNAVYLGAYAGYYETAVNKLFIDSLDRGTEALGRSNSLIYGVFNATPASQTLQVNGKLGVFTAPYEALTVSGDAVFSNATPNITLRNTGDNTAVNLHSNIEGASDPWGIFQISPGIDDGSGFEIDEKPWLWFSIDNDATFNYDLTIVGELKGSRHSFYFTRTTLSADAYMGSAALAMTAGTGVRFTRPGSIVGISLQFDTATATAMNIQLQARINNSDVFHDNVISNAAGSWGFSTKQARGIDTFSADDILTGYLDFVTGSGTIAPVVAMVEVVFDE